MENGKWQIFKNPNLNFNILNKIKNNNGGLVIVLVSYSRGEPEKTRHHHHWTKVKRAIGGLAATKGKDWKIHEFTGGSW